MDNSVPCVPLPPLIPADSTVTPSLIDKISLHSGRGRRRRSSPTATGIGCSSSDGCPGEIGVDSNDGQDLPKRDCLCSLLWHAQQKPDDVLVMSPGIDQCCHARHNNNTANNLLVNKEKMGDDGCWLAEENSLSQPENLLPGSGGETPPSVQCTSLSNSCSSSGTNGISSADLSPLAGDPENGCGSVDDRGRLSSSSVLFMCNPQNCPANFSASLTSTNNGSCSGKRKSEKTLANNLQVARPKEQVRDSAPCNASHQLHCHQRRPNAHRHLYVQDYVRPQTVNIPVESHYSMLDDSNQNSFSSVPLKSNALSVSTKLQPRCPMLSMNENAITCPTLKSTSVTDPQPLVPTPQPTTMMPYSNCVPFKQGPLVHGNGPMNGNMVCAPKCCMVCTPNGYVIASDFKSMDINKMSQQTNAQHLNNNQKKHSSVAELVNYKNGHLEASSSGTSNTKTVLLLQSNLNSSQPPQQQHYHTCKSLKCEKLAAGTQVNNGTPISSSSQVPTGTPPTTCVNCNTSVKSLNNANVGPSGTGGTNGKLVSKKCKALHNLQCKFQKNRFISSLQDCCRACNSYDGCRGSTESLELETGLLCPSYSYCDSDNVTSSLNSKDNHNYKNQLVSLVNERPNGAIALPLSKSNNNCSPASVSKTLPSNLPSNDFSSLPTGHVDIREEDFGDFIEADFPPVGNSGRLMSSSTDSTESCSSLTSSDIHDSNSPNPQPAFSPINNIATLVSDQTATHGVSSLCTTYFKNCDYKKNNHTSPPARTFQAMASAPAAAAASPMVTGANSSLKKCSKKTPPNCNSPLPATCLLSEFGDGNSVRREQASSVIKVSDVSKMSSSQLSSSSLSLQSPISSPSSSSSSPSSASFPSCSFLCSGDRHPHAKHKAEKNTSSGNGSRHVTTTNRSSNSCHNNNNSIPTPLPLTGISAACTQVAAPNSTTQQPSSATFLSSPEVDFLDFDLVTPNMDSEQNINSAGSSNGTTGFDFSLYEIPYADDVDSACPSPVEDLSPNLVIGAVGGGSSSSASHPVLANCATNDLSASSSNSNLSSRSTLEDTVLPPGHSNLETVRTRVQNAFSNLYLDYRDDASIDSEETGSHDSNEISEGDDQHPGHHLDQHHRRHCCGMFHSPERGCFSKNLVVLPESIASTPDVDLRDNPGVSEPIYGDIGVHLDKCTADSPDDKCCCVSPDLIHKTDVQVSNMQHSKMPASKKRHSSVERVMIWDETQVYRMEIKQEESDVSGCGPIAVLNVLNAFDFPVEKSKILEKAPINYRDTSAPIAPYLFSRAKAGTTAEVLINCVESVTNGAIQGRFFDFHPRRDVHLLKWLGEWMKKDAVPLATLNPQKVHPGWTIPDAWHHQMIFGVGPKGVHLTNPLRLMSEETIMRELTSDSVLLIRRFDIISRFDEDTNLSQLMTHKDSSRWRTMNVLGQVVNVLREDHMPRFPGYRPQLTQHIRIPAAYRAGITLFMRQDAAAFHELMNAPDLPLKVDLPQEVNSYTERDGDSIDKDEASDSCTLYLRPRPPMHMDHECWAENCGGHYFPYEYTDNNYYSGSSSAARVSPSVGFGPGAHGSDSGVGAGAAAAVASSSGNSPGSGLHPHADLHDNDYAGGARHFVNHGYPRRNNVYIHYFNS